jgi:pimeloyl-ACP methyl ester carboxylesterase
MELPCADTTLLNQLDGFSIYPQLRVCFSGPIKPATVSDGLFVVPLSQFAPWIRITRIVYDSTSHCVLAKPEKVLEGGKLYAMLATSAIRDIAGKPVKADPRFLSSLLSLTNAYTDQVSGLSSLIAQLGGTISAATLFTTLSANDWIHDARSFVAGDPVSSTLLPGFTVAKLSDLAAMTWLAQTKVTPEGAPPALMPQQIPLNRLEGVERVAIGTFLSPNFLSNTLTIPQVPTKTGVLTPQKYVLPIPVPEGYAPISFHVFLPSGPKPANGYPVAIYGHGMGDDQWMGATTYIASTLAKRGIALIGVEVFGHGYGPASAIQLSYSSAPPAFIPSPGRTIPVDGVNFDIARSGCVVLPGPFATRDCFRQTAADMFALVKLITGTSGFSSQLGLDHNRISYIGQSFGAVVGSMVVAAEPAVKTAVLNSGGGPVVDIARMQNPPLLAQLYLQMRNPPILTPDVLVFQGDPPAVTTNAAAPRAFDVTEWFNMSGDPLAFASALSKKRILHLISLGDQEVPNPANSTLIRAASAQSSTWLYRPDRACKIVGAAALPVQPHRFLSEPFMYDSTARTSIAKAAQQQVAEFIVSDGKIVADPDTFLTSPFQPGDNLFEVPKTLPDALNYEPFCKQ